MCEKTRLYLLFLFFISIFAGRPAAAAAPAEPLPLLPRAPLAREFRAGDRHVFTIDANADEYFELVCERRGVDVGLAVFAPGGERLAVSNAPAGFSGFDRLVFIAENAGRYRVELESRRPAAPLAGAGYTLVLAAARPRAGEDDERRARARRLLGEARTLLAGADDRLRKAAAALEKLEKARALFEKTDDAAGAAEALFHLALVNGYELGRKAQSIELYEKALALWPPADAAGRAIALTYFADEIRDYDSPDHPRQFYVGRAQNYFDEARALYRGLGDRFGEATALSFLCRLYNDNQNFQKGFDACREAQRLAGAGDPLIDYRIYGTLASLYTNSGDADNALKYNQTALARLELVGGLVNPYRKAFILSNIGSLYLTQKKYVEAEQNLRAALAIAEEMRRDLYSGYVLVRLSLICLEGGRTDEAYEAAQRAVEYYRATDPLKIQAALNALGRIQRARGRTDEARRLFAEAVEINRRNLDRYAEAESLYNLAKLEAETGELEAALGDVALAVGNSEVIRAQLLGKNQRTTYLSILKKYYELEIDVLVRLHDRTGDPAYLERAWQRHEKIRARSLLENLIESGLNLSEFAPPNYFADEQKLLETIAAAELRRTAAAKAANAAAQQAAEAELRRRIEEYQLLQESFRQKNPRFSAINQPPDIAPADARAMLEADTAVLEFALAEKQSYVWIIRRDRFALVKLPPKKTINDAARAFYEALTDRAARDDRAVAAHGRALSRMILEPLAGELGGARRIVVIADDLLQLVPFSALAFAPAASDAPAAETLEIVGAPSFSSLAFIRENRAARPQSAEKLLAVFADPIFQPDDERFSIDRRARPKSAPAPPETFPDSLAQAQRDVGLERLARLPFSGIEAREIGRFAPDRTVLALGARASRRSFLRGDFNSFRILHFATHGFLNQQNPELSGLVLSLFDEKRSPQNGFLRVIDLYSLRLSADLVVLSACQTALGKEIDGEGLVGLTRGFMYAGAAGVVSSLWKVEDAATAEFMKRFYRAMLRDGQPPAAALRTAQNELRRIPRFGHPRHWAGFALNGDFR